MQRHYGMDWLRIGAFALLILYHIGMVFVWWPFHVKAAETVTWASVPMMATNAWRLPLLFVVSGYASAKLFARAPVPGRFLANRTARLAIPFLAGCIFIIPPQPWVELVTQHGYAGSYLQFWARDYFGFHVLDGIVLPTWNHLWFVLYLFVYTLVLGLVLMMPGLAGLRPWFDRLFGGVGVWLLPLGWMILIHVVLFSRNETHALIDDGIAHLIYLPAFLFGFALAGSEPAMAAMRRWWWPAAIAAVMAYAVVASVELAYPGRTVPPRWVVDLYRPAKEIQAWSTIVALIGIADLWLNRDHPWRRTLTEAVFPFYIIHQTVIILVAYGLRPLGLGAAADFAILLGATVSGCCAFYFIGREIGPLRPLIGLKRRKPPAPSPTRPATVAA